MKKLHMKKFLDEYKMVDWINNNKAEMKGVKLSLSGWVVFFTLEND